MATTEHTEPAQEPSPPPRDYNRIFEKLVLEMDEENPEYLIGMLAYADYKHDKYRWMANHPAHSEEEKSGFLGHCKSEHTLKNYRDRAERILLAYAGEYARSQMDEELEERKNDALFEEVKAVEDRVEKAISQSKTGRFESILLGIGSSAIFSAFLFVSAVLVSVASPDSGFGVIAKYLVSRGEYELRLIKKDSAPEGQGATPEGKPVIPKE